VDDFDVSGRAEIEEMTAVGAAGLVMVIGFIRGVISFVLIVVVVRVTVIVIAADAEQAEE
jgi:hypothetical protein